MPFDRIAGERLEGLGDRYRVVPNAKWRETNLFNEAAEKAAEIFLKAGALWPISFDEEEVMTQEYPAEQKLAFLFEKTIKSRQQFYVWVWELPDQAVRELRALGKWDEIQNN